VVHGIICPTSRKIPWPGLFNSIQPLRHMRTLSSPGQAKHPSPLASGPKFLVGCFFDDTGGLCEPCCRFQGCSRSVFISIGIGGGLCLL
jgi:hypothetical protein